MKLSLFFSYLYRGDKKRDEEEKEKGKKSQEKDKDRSDSRRDRKGQKWQPFRGYTKSGKKIKGRGILVICNSTVSHRYFTSFFLCDIIEYIGDIF